MHSDVAPAETAAPPGRFTRFWPHALLLLAIALVWGHTVRFGFVWDDRFFIEELKSIRSFQHLPGMFYALDAQSSYPEGFVLFRPLRTVVYAALFQLGGGEPPQAWLFHLNNLLWHAAAVLLLYHVALLLFARLAAADETSPAKTRLFALLTALGLAVNPVVSETVCWAKSLDDLMATAFVLASLLCLLRWSSGSRWHAWAVGWFTLAVYSKISAVPFALAAFLVFRWFHQVRLSRALRLTSGFIVPAVVFLVHNHLVIGRSSQTAPLSGSYGQTLLDMLPVVPQYARLMFGIPPFCADYTHLKGGYGLTSPGVIAGLVLLLGLAAFAAWSARQPRLRLASFGVAWVGAFLLPVSNLMPMMQYMAERFLYLPLVGWLLALAALAWFGRRPLTIGLCAGVVALWMGVAWHRSLVWRDNLTLFVQSCQDYPQNNRMRHNAMAAVFQMPALKKFFQKDPRHPNEFVPVDDARLGKDEWLSAATFLTEARRLFPGDLQVDSELGVAWAKSGDFDKAIACFQAAVGRQPREPKAWANLGRAYSDAGRLPEARATLQKGLELSPNSLAVLKPLAAVHWLQEDYPAALRVLEKLQQLEPENADHRVWIERARAHISRGAAAPPKS